MITEITTETLKQTSNAMILPLLTDIISFCNLYLKLNWLLQVFITNSVNWSANRTIAR